MKSIIVVTSWWSNCLALMCLHRLVQFASGREIYVIQAGKSLEQMERFRAYLPTSITELDYPPGLLADDGVMREYLARDALREHQNVWFFDHDTFLLRSAVSWLDDADALLDKSGICLCTRKPLPRSGVTQPAYWMSPRRLPKKLSSFSPEPFEPKPFARRPDLYRHNGELTRPSKDTLVQVREELDAMGMVGTISFEDGDDEGCLLPQFPPHVHIGGLHLFTGPTRPPSNMPAIFYKWRKHVALGFDRFFKSCPQEWLSIEEPELVRRHQALLRTLQETRSKDE